ncbi:hypothetical protein [uncultured Algibacter sp.]|uniref:hypothetical protein n=1 Tax=uncultured Algibacter sp. TaxID=298659 RepID=UPI0026138EEA|nr:hypothetical protein [uncultured Algibacter sp.]
MKQLYVFIIILMLVSCEYFNVKKTSSEDILKEELYTFNWEDVDEYPSFDLCNTSETKTERKTCFQNTLVNHVISYLQKEVIVVTQDISDTILLKFQVNKLGHLELMQANIDCAIVQEIPNIEQLLQESLDSLPKIFAAIKRNQPVTTEFDLPIIISVN